VVAFEVYSFLNYDKKSSAFLQHSETRVQNIVVIDEGWISMVAVVYPTPVVGLDGSLFLVTPYAQLLRNFLYFLWHHISLRHGCLGNVVNKRHTNRRNVRDWKGEFSTRNRSLCAACQQGSYRPKVYYVVGASFGQEWRRKPIRQLRTGRTRRRAERARARL